MKSKVLLIVGFVVISLAAIITLLVLKTQADGSQSIFWVILESVGIPIAIVSLITWRISKIGYGKNTTSSRKEAKKRWEISDPWKRILMAAAFIFVVFLLQWFARHGHWQAFFYFWLFFFVLAHIEKSPERRIYRRMLWFVAGVGFIFFLFTSVSWQGFWNLFSPEGRRIEATKRMVVKEMAKEKLSNVQKENLTLVQEYFPNDPVMVQVIGCESGFHQMDPTDPSKVYVNTDSGAMGFAMILPSTAEDAARRYLHLTHEEWQKNAGSIMYEGKEQNFNPRTKRGNLNLAKLLREKDGLAPWEKSRHCWEPVLLAQGGSPANSAEVSAENVGLYVKDVQGFHVDGSLHVTKSPTGIYALNVVAPAERWSERYYFPAEGSMHTCVDYSQLEGKDFWVTVYPSEGNNAQEPFNFVELKPGAINWTDSIPIRKVALKKSTNPPRELFLFTATDKDPDSAEYPYVLTPKDYVKGARSITFRSFYTQDTIVTVRFKKVTSSSCPVF